MIDGNDVGLPCIELTNEELEAVSGSAIGLTEFFQILWATLRTISDMQNAAISKVNV